MMAPYKIKLELMSNEIEMIIEELNRIPRDLFNYMGCEKLIAKLKIELENGKRE